MSPSERAWCYRARRLAADLPFVAEFDNARMPAAEKKLRQLAAYEKEAERIAENFSYFGIRFVVSRYQAPRSTAQRSGSMARQ